MWVEEPVLSKSVVGTPRIYAGGGASLVEMSGGSPGIYAGGGASLVEMSGGSPRIYAGGGAL